MFDCISILCVMIAAKHQRVSISQQQKSIKTSQQQDGKIHTPKAAATTTTSEIKSERRFGFDKIEPSLPISTPNNDITKRPNGPSLSLTAKIQLKQQKFLAAAAKSETSSSSSSPSIYKNDKWPSRAMSHQQQTTSESSCHQSDLNAVELTNSQQQCSTQGKFSDQQQSHNQNQNLQKQQLARQQQQQDLAKTTATSFSDQVLENKRKKKDDEKKKEQQNQLKQTSTADSPPTNNLLLNFNRHQNNTILSANNNNNINNYNNNKHHHHHHNNNNNHHHHHQNHHNNHHHHQHQHHHNQLHQQQPYAMAHYKFHNDCQSSVLTYEQVKRLDFVMDQTVPIHGRGNYPTLFVKLKELIRLVKHKLQKEHSIEIRDVRLNGGAASYVLAPENSHYNDLDLIFGTDLSNEDQFDVIRDVVLDCLKEFYPKDYQQQSNSDLSEQITLQTSKENGEYEYEIKNNSHDSDQSTTKTCCDYKKDGQNSKDNYVDDDKIDVGGLQSQAGEQVSRSLQSQHQSYQMPLNSCAIKEAYVHKMVKVNDDDRWSLISLGVQQSETSCCGQVGNCNSMLNLTESASSQQSSNKQQTHIIGANGQQQFFVTIAGNNNNNHNINNNQQQKQFPNSIELKFVDRMRRKFEFSVDSFQIILDSLIQFYDYAPQSTIVSQRMLINSHPSSTMINIRPLKVNSNNNNKFVGSFANSSTATLDQKVDTSAILSKAVNTNNGEINYNNNDNFQQNHQNLRHNHKNLQHNHQQDNHQNLNKSFTNNEARNYYQLSIEASNTQLIPSIASSSGCSSSSSVVSSSSSSLSSCDEDHEDLYCDADTPPSSSASTSSLLSSSTISSSSLDGAIKYNNCAECSRQQRNQQQDFMINKCFHDANSYTKTPCAVISENFYPTVIGRSEYGNFKEALYHLEKKLIATRSPEEIRGGGLLKYCNLLVKDYKPTNVYQIRTLERYMCSRFFIDFSDLNQQQAKLESYLANHFSDDPILKFDYLTILHNVVQRSTVCLMNHELRLTLNMIRDLAYKLTTRFRQSYVNRM